MSRDMQEQKLQFKNDMPMVGIPGWPLERKRTSTMQSPAGPAGAAEKKRDCFRPNKVVKVSL
jgi:hypothetical protein